MMKRKTIIIVGLVLGAILASFIFYNKIFVDKFIIKQNFGIDFCNVQLEKLQQKEQWLPNGDGMKLQVFNFGKLDQRITKNLTKLPIKANLPPNEIPKDIFKNLNGYYKCIIDKNDDRVFKILLVDTLKKKIYVYYQVM